MTIFIAIAPIVEAQGSVKVTVKPIALGSPPYESISFVTEGPAFGFGDGDVRGKYHRILILNKGLAYDRPTLRIETLTYGDEVCCRRVIEAKELELDDLPALGLPLPDGATTELRFGKWKSASAAEFRYGPLQCEFTDIGKPQVVVSCNKAPASKQNRSLK